MCACQHPEAIHCRAVQEGLSFIKTMGAGKSCACFCHDRTDEQIVANFKEFLATVAQLNIKLKTERKDSVI